MDCDDLRILTEDVLRHLRIGRPGLGLDSRARLRRRLGMGGEISGYADDVGRLDSRADSAFCAEAYPRHRQL